MKASYDVSSPRQAHQAVNDLFKQVIKPHTAKGAAGRVSFEPINPELRHEMRKLFHGPILSDFAWQVWVYDPNEGKRVRYTPEAWKLLLKGLFCPARFDEKTGAELEKSTEALTDDEFAEFLLAVQAYGVMEHGIEFTERAK